jgi:hypothetical protein
LGNFAASAIAGILWTTVSPTVAFLWLAASMAVASVAFLMTWTDKEPTWQRADENGPAESLAAYNLETIRSFLARKAVVEEEAKKPRRRNKRRTQTCPDLVAVHPCDGARSAAVGLITTVRTTSPLDQGRHRRAPMTPLARSRGRCADWSAPAPLQPTRERAKHQSTPCPAEFW